MRGGSNVAPFLSMDQNSPYYKIYNFQGATYHEMISFEDVEGNLRPALESVIPFGGKTILDLGTGTGRIPLLFPDAQVAGLDLHANMLHENQRQQSPDPGLLVQADMRHLPFLNQSYEIVTSGWVLAHFIRWFGEKWQDQIKNVLNEVARVLQPGGFLIIIETMTTGSLSPAPPTPGLAEYYRWLEEDLDFKLQVIQTDFQFDDLDQAARYAQFFFGENLAKKVRKHNWVRLPEWTGIWSKQIN